MARNDSARKMVAADGFGGPQAGQGIFRAFDWSSTALGSISQWSLNLRCWVNVCMSDPRPVAVWWGLDRECVYNDSYESVLGARRTWALGKPVHKVWPEDDSNVAQFRAAFDLADATGQPSFGANACFFLERSGFLEETWAQWALIPIMWSTRNIGYYNPVSETTKEVLFERRRATLLALEQEMDKAFDLESFFSSALAGFQSNWEDIPFAAAYFLSDDSPETTPRSSTGSRRYSPPLPAAHWVLAAKIELNDRHLGLPFDIDLDIALQYFGPGFASAIETNAVELLDLTMNPCSLSKVSHSRAWPTDLCTKALIIPLAHGRNSSHKGFLVLGLNPRSWYDSEYKKFTALVVRQLCRTLDAVCLKMEETRITSIESALASKEHEILTEKLSSILLDASHKEARFRRMADMALVGMFEVGADGTLNYANNTWYEMTAYPHGNFAPLDWVSTIHPDDRGWFADKWLALTSGETLKFEIRFCKPYISDDFINGERIHGITWAACAAYAEFQDGRVTNVVGTIVDISRHKWNEKFQECRTAEALELKRQQEAFMDMISHEARNPLAAMSLCVEGIVDTCEAILTRPKEGLLVSRDTIDSTLDSANTIMACVAHQKTIIDDVLTLSKLRSGLLQTSPVEVQPISVIVQALGMFEAELQSADIELDFHTDESFYDQEITYALLDPTRLRQILINLITNAIKFTRHENKRHISVSLAASAEPPARSLEGIEYLSNNSDKAVPSPGTDCDPVYLSMTVKDTGCGIAESELKHLFQRFQQGSLKTHAKYGGSGLGLFICKELARIQGGQIGVTSESGKGSTFAFYIKATKCVRILSPGPAIPNNVRETRKAREWHIAAKEPSVFVQEVAVSKSVSGCHLLLVEDNLVNQRVMAKQLRRAGCTVTIANHGEEALDHIRATEFAKAGGVRLDVVLCDIEMPVMGGIECSRAIRKMEKQGTLQKAVPLIAVTANARIEQQEDALEAGFDAVITKPFRMNALLPELKRFCLASDDGQ